MYALSAFSAMLHTTECNFTSQKICLLWAFKLISGSKATHFTFKIKNVSFFYTDSKLCRKSHTFFFFIFSRKEPFAGISHTSLKHNLWCPKFSVFRTRFRFCGYAYIWQGGYSFWPLMEPLGLILSSVLTRTVIVRSETESWFSKRANSIRQAIH